MAHRVWRDWPWRGMEPCEFRLSVELEGAHEREVDDVQNEHRVQHHRSPQQRHCQLAVQWPPPADPPRPRQSPVTHPVKLSPAGSPAKSGKIRQDLGKVDLPSREDDGAGFDGICMSLLIVRCPSLSPVTTSFRVSCKEAPGLCGPCKPLGFAADEAHGKSELAPGTRQK